MTLVQVLTTKRMQILGKWFDLILETYPEDTARLLKREKDRFRNPVGYNTYQSICEIFDGLCQGENTGKLIGPINNIVRIRSVQDFKPSEAVIFIPLLKQAIREICGNDIESNVSEILRFESIIDELTLQAFNIYTEYRNKICEIRINEIKTQREEALRLLQRMDAI